MPPKMYLGETILAGLLAFASLAESKTVRTKSGVLQGGTCSNRNVDYFFSIPYAKPPVGELRFAPPEPYTNSSCKTINATVPAPSCIQFSDVFGEEGQKSEDCLYLDVWAPASATQNSSLPVKVWLYGGSNAGGGISDATYGGCESAADSIVVSINYRVGPLGYLALEDLGLSGNYGIMDQLLALRWVHENVAAFGGDPEKVLLFGQSAGAIDSFILSTLPETEGLIRAAALESGAGRDLATIADAKILYSEFVAGLNCSKPDLPCLRSASPAALQVAASAIPGPGTIDIITALADNGTRTTWTPVVDGKVIMEQPSAVGVKVPSIIGSTANEGSLFVLGFYQAAAISNKLTQADYDKFLTYNFGPLAGRVNETFSLDKAFNGSVTAAVSTVVGDVSYKCPSYRALAKAEQNGVPVWSYLFDHHPSCAWYDKIKAEWLPYLGAPHTSEIPFVFNFTTAMPPPDGSCTFTAEEQAMSHAMSRAWTNMAAVGSPDDEQAWPAWTKADSKGVVIKDAMKAGVVDYSRCEFWDVINTELNVYASIK
ncbi:alpha/beta-hydrolase [Hypoxylon sp. FL1284]|nr:alpha/beta-hydrolase [Hypoxylon sp. FL1284]